jgi:hypothetical protein
VFNPTFRNNNLGSREFKGNLGNTSSGNGILFCGRPLNTNNNNNLGGGIFGNTTNTTTFVPLV